MDPVSHAALGRTLIAFDARRRLGRGSSAACILGALSPDLDLARAFQGWDVYLRAHQGGTHALVGAAGCGLLTATVLRVAVRGSRWAALAIAAIAGALSHVVLDLMAGGDIRPLWPLSTARLRLPLFAMADPWLFSVLCVSLLVLWRARRPRAAVCVLAVVLAMSALKGALFARATRLDRAAVPAADTTHAEAVFASWSRWTFFHAYDDVAERWTVDAERGRVERVLQVRRGAATPEALRSTALPTVQNLLASHDVTLARTRRQPDGRHEVLWTDLRYCAPILETSEPVCGLWFGGEYDARGQPATAVVHVGTLLQRRAAEASSHHE